MAPLFLESTSRLALAQQDRFSRLPFWVWILLIVGLVIIVGIIITLKEEQQAADQPAGAPLPPSPPEPEKLAPEAADLSPAIELRPDKLTRVKGIGPKIEKLLNNNGITTFARLAETEVDWLQNLLVEAGWENIADPATWPDQARQLAGAKSGQG